MSRIEGIDTFLDGIKRFEDEVAKQIGSAIETEVRAMQVEASELVPVDSGQGKAALLSAEAIEERKSPDGPGKRFVFGFITARLKAQGYYLFWVEFGTKGYAAGERRVAGKSKQGRTKYKKVKTAVAPKPAQPFWRPAEANMWRRLQRRLDMQRLISAAKRAANLASQD